MFDIKRYDISCIDDVLAFEKELRKQEDFWGWEINEEYVNAIKRSFVDDRFKYSLSMLAYEGDKVVGRIDTTLVASHFCGAINAYLDWLCVLKSHRHKGVAQHLMRVVRQELKKCGVDSLIGIVAHNDEALRYYRSVNDSVIEDNGIRIKIR